MKITEIRTFLVDRYLLVRVYTDAGIVGNGEAGLWAHHPPVRAAIDELSDYFLGKDPRRVEHHHQVVTRDTHFTGSVLSAALSAIDVALWDILGKSVDLPVHQLFGGRCRDKVRVFANVQGSTPEQRAQSAGDSVQQGFTSLRMTPFTPGWESRTPTEAIGAAVEMVQAVRDAVGYQVDLGLEIHRNLKPDETITLARELAPYRIAYYEDPIPPESISALEYVARHVDIPLAAGERQYGIYQFKELIDTKAVGLIRLDVSLAGGFTAARKIAALSEAAFVGIFPHLMGSPVNNAAFVQFAASIPNFVVMESNVVPAPLSEIVDRPVDLDQGYRIVPDRPGIGVEIDEKRLADFPPVARPVVGNFHADGSVAH